MSEAKIYPVPESVRARAHLNHAQYLAMYRRSLDDPDGFWAEQADALVSWSRK
ncbi:MAG: acetate/CoA ligase [Gammaproteobacteria bacterium]|nr:acetate/CoA ligase [Gammaproteobacteria bacterium]